MFRKFARAIAGEWNFYSRKINGDFMDVEIMLINFEG